MNEIEIGLSKEKLYKKLCEIADDFAFSYYEWTLKEVNEWEGDDRSEILDKKGRIDLGWLLLNYGDQLGETLNELDDVFPDLGADRNEIYDVLYSYFEYTEIEAEYYRALYDYCENIYGKEAVDKYRN